MGTRSCSCGGSNDNCSRCFGRGFIEDPASSVEDSTKGAYYFPSLGRGPTKPKSGKKGKGTLPATPVRKAQPNAKPVSTRFSESLLRAAARLVESYSSHTNGKRPGIEKEHSRNETEDSQQKPCWRQIKEGLLICPGCAKAVKYKEIGRHLSNSSVSDSRHRGVMIPTHVWIHGRVWVLCPGCSATLKTEDRLQAHLRSVHGIDSKEILPSREPVRKLSKSNPNFVKSASRRKPHSHHRIAMKNGSMEGKYSRLERWKQDLARFWRDDRHMDHTRGYAHGARENGRFGSHPSHDGFDDRSGPDCSGEY